jgi:phage terminase large subunit
MPKVNKVFKHLENSDKRITIEQGGTRSGKTYNILLWLIFGYAMKNTGKTITICRKTYPSLRASSMRDFFDILKENEIYNEADHNKSNSEYRLEGNLFEFISLDQPQKVRGRKRDVLYINEANELYFEDWQQLIFRTTEKAILDYNPSDEFHFIYDKIKPREDADFYITTYKDNPFLSDEIINEIERLKLVDENYWNIYGLGQIGSSQALIFRINECNSIPTEAKFLSYGMDFGFTNDPTTLVAIYQQGDNIYLKELLYQTGLTNRDINDKLKFYEIERKEVFADSAEPKSIEELYRMGWNIKPATKGQGSVNIGIDMMKRYQLHVTKDSVNMIKEFRNYKWQEDKNGNILNVPVDMFNHCFTGETLITTNKGQIRIDKIKVGDLVLTSQGYKRVLKCFDNGIKIVNKYSMQLDTNVVSLCSTKEHKIKTTKEWKQISKLQNRDLLFQYNGLMEKIINFTKTKDILAEEQKDYIRKFGNIIKEKFQKDMIFITLIIIPIITIYQILIWLIKIYIKGLLVSKELKAIQNGLKNFTLKVLKLQKNGINQKLDYNGTRNTGKQVGIIGNIKNLFVKYAIKNMKADTLENQSIVITTVKLKHFEKGESYKAQVYDLMVEDCHEYFANGILVHNCIDAIRYGLYDKLARPNYGKYAVR